MITDLSYLKSYIIDEDDSRESDDAISIEYVNSRLYLWIHIANPCKYIEKDSLIDRLAQKKGASIYLLSGYVPMLPSEIINKSSLSPHKTSETLSARVYLDDEGLIQEYLICRSKIKPNYKINYEDANLLIDLAPKEEPDLYLMHKRLINRRRQREINGAIVINQSQGKFVNSVERPVLKIVDQINSRNMISEAMILMGSIIGQYSKENNISVPYRGMYCNNKINNNYNGLYYKRNWLQKYHLRKAYVSTRPSNHSALGIKYYVQATSPLRRYLDLFVLRQILLNLDGKDTLNKSSCEEYISLVSRRLEDNNQLFNEETRLCQYNWFKNNRNKNWKIIYIREISSKDNLSLVRFEELEMDIICILECKYDLNFGDEYHVSFSDRDILSNSLCFNICN